MGQVTWRVDDALLGRVRVAAERDGRSVNEFLTVVLSAMTDPATAGTEMQRIRERLAAAGLLAATGAPRKRPPSRQVAAARREAGRGSRPSDLVVEDRR